MLDNYLVAGITVMMCATFLTRALPFLFLQKHKDHIILDCIGRYLPPMTMLLLVVYCLKDINLTSAKLAAPELAGVSSAIILQLLLRLPLVSIVGSTTVFVLLSKNLV